MDAMEKLWHTILILCICKPLVGSGYTPTDNYLIACGSNSNTTSGRLIFTPDGSTSSVSIKTDKYASAKANRTTQNLSAIYLTARVFLQQSSYSFKINQQGKHWVRLHFFPFSGSGYNLTTAVFSVSTDKFGLLSNFQLNDSSSSVLKEYLINTDIDPLTLTFMPSNNSFAFINAIEVVSAPDNLIPNEAQSVPLVSTFSGLSGHALQTIHRLNMGGPLLSPDNDTLERFWYPDSQYLVNPNGAQSVSVGADTIIYQGSINSDFAPNKVYATAEEMSSANTTNANYNISWKFDVDPGYQYFVRMHFCDIVSSALNQLYFIVYINDYTAISTLDLSNKLGVLRAAYYADFVTPEGLKTLYVKVAPVTNLNPLNAILNGLEILKLSNSQSSLDGAFAATSTGNSKNKTGAIIGSVVGSICVLGLLSVIYFLCCRPKCKAAQAKPSWLLLPQHGGHSDTVISKDSKASATSHASSGQTSRGRLFTFSEIQEATKNFDESLIIGVGGFGKVYKGILEDGTVVAIKRGNPSSEQGIAEFRTEIELLSKLRHRHLVSLIGFCEERCEMILVYEYMANGPLRSHLYGNDNLEPLPWKLRLDICIGAARGLHYLHTGAEQGIIHRDVKTTNILLDENFVAKVADFGLSKTGPSLDQTHVSTAVKGSFGYLDPEYFRRQQLTEKSDVYSFGVVLMEVLCARPAINPALPRDQVNIAEWAMHWQRRGMLEQIIDRNLVGHINLNSLRKYGETAEKCLADQGIDRPSMGDVLWNLEYALQLQETAMLDDPDEASTNRIGEIPMSLSASQTIDNSMVEKNSFASIESSDSATTNTVFSQLANPQGR